MDRCVRLQEIDLLRSYADPRAGQRPADADGIDEEEFKRYIHQYVARSLRR
ncbi:MAG: hypothetical protein ACLS8R_08115 [Anaeromassilibacillus sp.]